MTENYSTPLPPGSPQPNPGTAAPPPTHRKTSGLAVGSLICGLGGLVSGLLAGLPAIIMGHSALGKIGRSGGALGGKGLALTGVILGYLSILVTIVIVLAAVATPQIFKALKRAALAEAINNAKQVKLALDSFATDFDGVYPSDDTAEYVAEGGTGSIYSNDYFRQLFLAGSTKTETIFWVKNSAVAASTAPDNEVTRGGRVQADMVLEEGDVHWAYITEQTNLDTGSRPLILDGYKKNTSEWDPDTWDNKVIVLTIDGACKPMRMRVSDGKILDWKGKDILSSQADAWDGESPTDLLKQPQPAR